LSIIAVVIRRRICLVAISDGDALTAEKPPTAGFFSVFLRMAQRLLNKYSIEFGGE
jgi:hypothetical protein